MKVQIHPRLHISLISMHNNGIRRNGGIGFAIGKPKFSLDLSESREFCFYDRRESPFIESEINDIHGLAGEIIERYSLKKCVAVTLTGRAKTHVGLGTGTAVRLGIIEGLFLFNDRAISDHKLQVLSKRGGTSGVGINTYFSGGLIFDLGTLDDGKDFSPSSITTPKQIPLKLPSVQIPNWPLCVCIPNFIQPKTQEEEIDFFSRVTPISPVASYKALYYALFGVYSAAIERNFLSFCQAIDALQTTKWKMLEWLEYGSELRHLESLLRSFGAQGVGMSSLGPLLYCFGSDEVLSSIYQNRKILNCTIIRTFPINHGREVTSN